METQLKSILAMIVVVISTTTIGFSQENVIDLKSPEVQKEVFNQILNDHHLMANFVEQLKTNDHALKMVMGDIMKCCESDSSTCKNMSAIMGEHDKVLQQLGKYLDEKEQSTYVVRERRYKHR